MGAAAGASAVPRNTWKPVAMPLLSWKHNNSAQTDKMKDHLNLSFFLSFSSFLLIPPPFLISYATGGFFPCTSPRLLSASCFVGDVFVNPCDISLAGKPL